MRRRLVLALVLLAALAGPARAAEWDLLVPGLSTVDAVRARFGQPTRAQNQKVEGYDALEWVYEGATAPAGLVRLTVDFGLLTATGYKKDLVRSFRLDPKPGIFNKVLVVDGWGQPTRVGREGPLEVFFYEAGLLVYFGQDGGATLMVFTPPQPVSAAPPPK